ncbi:MAG: putative oxidoreductase/Short-chain dehydrogenase [Actinomycetia bacterium]|nr:putative oxidoreductase/Short-chain dehydrogenase [Actinomycetes bacterium]
MTRWTAADIPDQTGRTFIVTGANSGLGLETARQLAAKGADVIMTARSEAKGRAAVASIGGSNLDLRLLDLSDLDSVRAFAEGVEHVDVLVNNAGIMMPPRSLTKQGFELQFGTNHLGHFALTGLLFDRLRKGQDARIVTVSSSLHRSGSIHFDDLTGEKKYSPTGFYSQSKFANVLFGLELDRRLRAAGLPLRSLLAHPGYSNTNLQSSGPTGIVKQLMKVSNVIMAQSVEMGALDQLYAATAPGAESGQFIGPDRLSESRGHPKVVQPVKSAQDPETARRLWDLSEDLTGVRFTF